MASGEFTTMDCIKNVGSQGKDIQDEVVKISMYTIKYI